MAKCKLEVVLSKPEPTVRPGDWVEGTAYVHLDKAVTCKRFSISCFWRTHGRGNRTQGEPQILTPFSGEWIGDRTYEYPFEFQIPEGPPTYHGELLNVDWYVRAEADIPWAIDPNAEAEFRMLPGEPKKRPTEPYHGSDGGQPRPFRLARGDVPPWAGCLMGLVFVGVFIAGALDVFGWDLGGFGMFCVMGMTMALLAGGAIVFLALRNRMAIKKLGDVHLSVSNTALRPGDEIDVELSFSPKDQLELRAVTVTLACFERVVSGSGTNQTTHTKDIRRDEIVLREAGPVRPPERVHGRATLAIPKDAPPTFQAPSNSLNWTLDVRIDIPRWPDWTQHIDLTVDP